MVESNDKDSTEPESPDSASEPLMESKKQVSFSYSPSSLKKYAIAAGAVVLLVVTSVFVVRALPNSTFNNAADECLALSDRGLTIDEDGRSMYLNGEGEESGGMGVFSQVCILEELGVPDSVFDRINNTNSTMGVQEASWDNFQMSWSYHPNNGLDVSVELN